MKVYRSNRAERLAEVLSEVLSTPSGDPFQPETVVVEDPGVARWLSMKLSQRLGVCSGVRFPALGDSLREAYIAVLGDEAEGLVAWRPERIRWAVLDVLHSLIDCPELSRVAGYLRDEPNLDGERSCGLALRIAQSLVRYIDYRPEMIRRWAGGEQAGWQSEMYRAVRSRISAPHLADLTPRFIERCREDSVEIQRRFPRRVCCFGMTTLPPSTMSVLSALAAHIDVSLFLVSATQEPLTQIATPESGHPLVSSMGCLSLDFRALLAAQDVEEPRSDLWSDPSATPRSTMLEVLQSDILSQRHRMSGVSNPPSEVEGGDRSISIHSCHGPMRQVEVLRDQLLALFERCHDVHPQDVVVLTPDIEAYAPLIQAVFNEPASSELYIPFRIADMPRRRQSQVVEAFLRIIDMAGSRMTAPDVLDLLALEPVRSRFEIAPDDMETIIEWVRESGIRWGIDRDHRLKHGRPTYEENTWRFGLDRLLLGYAIPGHGRWLFQGTLPFDEVEGGIGVLLGQFVEFCHCLFKAVTALEGGPRPLRKWRETLTEILGELTASTPEATWEHELIRSCLSEIVADAESIGAHHLELQLGALRAILLDHLSQRDELKGFLTGQLTFCSMVPFRAIPSRVVCLLGMDDGVFPRSSTTAEFDLTLGKPLLGDRTERDEDKQLFLDVVLSARDRLLIFYSGRSIKDNRLLPPSTPVSELLDTLIETFSPDGAQRIDGNGDDELFREARRRRFVVQHPLQPFSPRNFDGTDLRVFTFDQSYLEGARAMLEQRKGPQVFIDGPLTGVIEEQVALSSLLDFFEHPIRALLERRLGVRFITDKSALAGLEPLELDALDRYKLAQPLLERHLSGEDDQRTLAAIRAAGVLPSGTLGRSVFEDVTRSVNVVARAVRELRGDDEPQEPVMVDYSLAGMRIRGPVESLWPQGLIDHRFVRLGARHLLRLWITHLVLGCSQGTMRRSTQVGRAAIGKGVAVYVFSPASDPRELLEELLCLYRVGLSRPLLFFPKTSKAYADVVLRSGDVDDPDVMSQAFEAASKAWYGGAYSGAAPGEVEDVALKRTFGRRLPFEHGLELYGVDHPRRTFHELALTVYRPLMNHLTEVA